MWTRKSVKEKGKKAFKLNYWKTVLVAIILGIVLGASGGFSGMGSSITSITHSITGRDSSSSSTAVTSDDDHGFSFYFDFDDDDDSTPATITPNMNPQSVDHEVVIAILVVMGLCFLFSLIISIFALAFKYLLLTPFEYGCRKFFRKNLDEPAKLSNIVYVFDSNYKNVVKTAFLRDLFIWLWSLLFIIPGIIKSYAWRLVPYIMSEDPTMNFKDALAESERLMKGNKWKSFVLDLSFIGWKILSACTLGMLGIFFVDPYKASTDAALYETLKYGIDAK